MDSTIIKEFAIPMLPSNSIKETLEFYTALGFTVTYRQKSPNTYICFKIRDIELHFFALKQLKPENNFSSCYLVVDKIDVLFNAFSKGLKDKFGKIPVKGIPRINPLKDMHSYGVRQFVVVDPSGNYIRIGQPIKKEKSLLFSEDANTSEKGTALEKAYELGNRLTNGMDDLQKTAKVLDNAIKSANNSDLLNLFRVITLRLDIANRESDSVTIKTLSIKANELLKQLSDISTIKKDIETFEQIVSDNS